MPPARAHAHQRVAGCGKARNAVVHDAPDVAQQRRRSRAPASEKFGIKDGDGAHGRIISRGIEHRSAALAAGDAASVRVRHQLAASKRAGPSFRPRPACGAAPALQRLGAHRPRRREQEALAEAHVVVEQIDHRALALDALGDQVDAGARQQIGEVGRDGCRSARRRRG